MEVDLDISGAFKVSSWLNGVDTHNREQVLKSCEDWDLSHTQLLMTEIEAQVRGSSLLGIELVRTDQRKLVYASALLSKYSNCPCSPVAIGLTLIS